MKTLSTFHVVSLALLCKPLLSGCEPFNVVPRPAEKLTKVEQEPLPQRPSRHSLHVAPYVFHSDFELKADVPIFKELAGLRDQVYKELQLPSGDALIEVFVFQDRDCYERFIRKRYPDLPRRRAFFVVQPRWRGGPEDLLVYTYWGERVRQDLRHELTHALLHSVIRHHEQMPIWLDEGLAEYFELPPQHKGINPQHLDLLRPNANPPFKPDLARLEALTEVQQMTPAAYRESWAWVHFMLTSGPETKAILVNHLHQLTRNQEPGLLRPRLTAVLPSPEEALVKHLTQLQKQR